MNEQDPAAQIAEALSRLRWRGRPMHPGRPSRLGHAMEHEGRGPHAHRGSGGRGSGGPALGRPLSTLDAALDGLGVSEIAEAIGVDQPRASRLVAQAVDLGLVRREADPADARKIRIALTEQGDATARRIRGERGAAVREALAGFSDAEREQLAELLGRLADAWPDSARGMR